LPVFATPPLKGTPDVRGTRGAGRERALDDRDRRRNVVRLTRAGATALEHLEERVEHAQAALLAPLSADEHAPAGHHVHAR
jgi:hypothetical protein